MRRLIVPVDARRASPGQVLVIFALGLTVLFGAAGLAFDIGRFYSERRFLQNAADAAALAAANSMIRGENTARPTHRARAVLAANFSHAPNGSRRRCRRRRPVYETGHAGDPECADQRDPDLRRRGPGRGPNTVGYTFGRAVGLDQQHDRRPGPGRRPWQHAADRRAATTSTLPGRARRHRSPCADDQTRVHGLLRDGEHRVPRDRDQHVTPVGQPPAAPFDCVEPRQRPDQPRPGHRDPRPGRAAEQRRRLPRVHRPRHPQLPASGVPALLQRRDRRRRTPTRSRTWRRTGSRPVDTRAAVPGRDHAARPERPGRDHVRQLDRRRRSMQSTSASCPATRSSSRSTPGNVMSIPDFTITLAGDSITLPTTGTTASVGSDQGLGEPAVLRSRWR